MRLWHHKLIPFLPKSQLIAQWRELNSIYSKQDRHILINYIYDYPKEHLRQYSDLVLEEMIKRGYKYNLDKHTAYFGCNIIICSQFDPFPDHHNDRYLIQCFFNLQEKHDRGQKDFSDEEYNRLAQFASKYLD